MFGEINIEHGGRSGARIGRRGGGDRFSQLRPSPHLIKVGLKVGPHLLKVGPPSSKSDSQVLKLSHRQ